MILSEMCEYVVDMVSSFQSNNIHMWETYANYTLYLIFHCVYKITRRGKLQIEKCRRQKKKERGENK